MADSKRMNSGENVYTQKKIYLGTYKQDITLLFIVALF